MLRRQKVRVHLADPHPQVDLPSVEGFLVGRGRFFRIALPSLLVAEGRPPAELESRELVIPRERVAFYEVL